MKNDFLTLIKTRRSIRAYKPDAVPADTLARVLEAGTYAPSAMGEQSATIVAVETKAYRDRLTKLNAAVIGRDVDPYYGAPVIVVVLGDGERANYLADGSCVLENLMLAAHAEGLGTVWVNRTRVKIVKNKVAPPFKTAEFDMIYGEGISRESCILDMAVDQKIINKTGAWYSYNDMRMAQGRDNARLFLKDNKELCDEIEARVREKMMQVPAKTEEPEEEI